MYPLMLILSLAMSVSLAHTDDPFQQANAYYSNSAWGLAHKEYTRIFEKIRTKVIDERRIDKKALIRGHVNFADVLWSLGISEWQEGRHEEANKKWQEACAHWTYRLEGGQFGRTPLDDEWDGSDPTGKTIVVFSERDAGAFGDTFYASFLLRHLKNRGARVVLVPQKPLKALYETEGTLQAGYVDKVVVRGEQLPPHDAKVYLWSLFKDYVQKQRRPFPASPWLSAPGLTPELEQLLKKHSGKLLVGFWYRSSGSASKAADYRSLDRDPGAHRMLTALQGIPGVTIICLEGMGHRPVNEREYEQRQRGNTLGNLDPIDKTSHNTSSVVVLPESFDRTRGAFVDTAAVMRHIKKQGGVLVGCDTGLLNMAAGIEKPEDDDDPSVYAVLNEKADFRWGSKRERQDDGSIKPRRWYLSSDAEVFQAPTQGKWEVPLAQVRERVKERAARRTGRFQH